MFVCTQRLEMTNMNTEKYYRCCLAGLGPTESQQVVLLSL